MWYLTSSVLSVFVCTKPSAFWRLQKTSRYKSNHCNFSLSFPGYWTSVKAFVYLEMQMLHFSSTNRARWKDPKIWLQNSGERKTIFYTSLSLPIWFLYFLLLSSPENSFLTRSWFEEWHMRGEKMDLKSPELEQSDQETEKPKTSSQERQI